MTAGDTGRAPGDMPTLSVVAAGRVIEIRGDGVFLDGRPRPVSPAARAVLLRLATTPGAVVSRTALRQELPAATSSQHALETAISRLRSGLGDPALVRTVVKRGYRLAPASGAGDGS